VYVTLVGEDDPEACILSVGILNKTSSFLRTVIGRELTMRSAPKLHFYYDESAVRGQKISSLIDRAVASDKMNRAVDSE
jgi:ribosome-binding factor A